MTKLVQNDIASLTNEQSALAALNANYASLEGFSDTVLSRDGTSPNQMNADLDMNSNRILNLPVPVDAGDPLRLQDLSDFTGGGSIVAGAPTNASYVTLSNNGTLTAERVLTAGSNVTLTDSGANGTLTVAALCREKLTADRTYFVRTDGNNSNTGLVNSAGGAFLTIQKGVDTVLKTIDSAGFNVTIQIADGTYTGQTIVSGPMIGATAAQQFIIKGNTTTPANVVLNTAGVTLQVSEGADVYLRGVKVTSSAGAASIWVTRRGSQLWFDSMDFGTAAAYQLWVTDIGFANVSGNYTISGGAQCHYVADTKGVIFAFSSTATLTGTPAFSVAFANAYLGGQIESSGMTFSGGATGQRYQADQGALITTGTSGNITYFPGNSNGRVLNRGVYDLVPSFRAHKNGTDQTGIVSATFTALTYSNESFDDGNYFTANAWTPPGGKVRLYAIAQFTANIVDQNALFIEIQKDGGSVAQKQIEASGTGAHSVDIRAIDDANGANVYTVRVRGDGAGNKTVSGNGSLTWFEGQHY